jgi:hypothetical protein
VGDLTGPRSRFLLSRLVTCARCGSRYEGYTLRTRPPRPGGDHERYYTYACGGYIRRGKSVCELGAVPQQELEEAVIRAVLQYYARYEGERGRLVLAAGVRKVLGLEAGDVEQTLERARSQLASLDTTARRLLDNITAGTQALVEKRLREIESERAALRTKAESLERLSLSKSEVRSTTDEVHRFIRGLNAALRSGPLEHRQATIRRSVETVRYEHAQRRAFLRVRSVPLLGTGGPRSAELVELIAPVN